jgi:Uncharacterized BCR, YaiI/YqxD family COG1671
MTEHGFSEDDVARYWNANAVFRTPPSEFIRSLRVKKGFDVADDHIVRQVQSGDPVATADIPLKGCSDSLKSTMGSKPIGPSEMTKRIWAYVKKKRLASK